MLGWRLNIRADPGKEGRIMWYVGIDLHRKTVVIAMVSDDGEAVRPRRFKCSEAGRIIKYLSGHSPFRAVIEASSSYRWLYDLLSAHGEVVLAHPLRLRAIWSGRAKTDELDSMELAKLLRADLIPRSYVPPAEYLALRDLTRARAKLVMQRAEAVSSLRALLARANIEPPYRKISGPCGRAWLSEVDLGEAAGSVRDELVERVAHFERAIAGMDRRLAGAADRFPEREALTCLYGIGEYSALLIVAELGEPGRFSRAEQVGAYSGLTSRVRQSGETERRGPISKEGSPWLRWILVEAAPKVIRKDEALRRFYDRIRKRSGWRRARVAVARKLAEICWKRLMKWSAEHAA
jgi:transposase